MDLFQATGCINYYYQMRSNITHRSKSSYFSVKEMNESLMCPEIIMHF